MKSSHFMSEFHEILTFYEGVFMKSSHFMSEFQAVLQPYQIEILLNELSSDHFFSSKSIQHVLGDNTYVTKK